MLEAMGGTVGLDIRVMGSNEGITGVPSYVLHLARYLVRRGDSVLFSDEPTVVLPCNVVRSVVKALPWQQFALPMAATRAKIGIFHGPAFSLPMWGKFRKIVTIHDLAYVKNRDWMKDSVYTYLKRMVPMSLKVSEAIIVPTRQVKQDLLEAYPRLAKEESIFVIPMGSEFAPDAVPLKTTAAYAWNRPYILHVGTIEPRKNLETLIRAFSVIVHDKRFPHALILAGAYGWKYDGVLAAIQQSPSRDRIFRLGYVDGEELERLHRGADLYVQPSFYEGFGMSTLDAYCLGVPIVSTRTGWISEISEDNIGWVTNPFDVSEMAEAIGRMLDARPPKATTQGAEWSWERTMGDHERLYGQIAKW